MELFWWMRSVMWSRRNGGPGFWFVTPRIGKKRVARDFGDCDVEIFSQRVVKFFLSLWFFCDHRILEKGGEWNFFRRWDVEDFLRMDHAEWWACGSWFVLECWDDRAARMDCLDVMESLGSISWTGMIWLDDQHGVMRILGFGAIYLYSQEPRRFFVNFPDFWGKW